MAKLVQVVVRDVPNSGPSYYVPEVTEPEWEPQDDVMPTTEYTSNTMLRDGELEVWYLHEPDWRRGSIADACMGRFDGREVLSQQLYLVEATLDKYREALSEQSKYTSLILAALREVQRWWPNRLRAWCLVRREALRAWWHHEAK